MGRTRYLSLIFAIALLLRTRRPLSPSRYLHRRHLLLQRHRPYDEDERASQSFYRRSAIPVVALDAYGHYDPTLVIEDVLVLEDGVAQQIRSVSHIPANVLFVLDTGGGDSSGLGGVFKEYNFDAPSRYGSCAPTAARFVD